MRDLLFGAVLGFVAVALMMTLAGLAHCDDTSFVQAHIDARESLPAGDFTVDCVPGKEYALLLPDHALLQGAGRSTTSIRKKADSTVVCDLLQGDNAWYVLIADITLDGRGSARRIIHNHSRSIGFTLRNVTVRDAFDDCMSVHWANLLAFDDVRFALCGGSAFRSLGIDNVTGQAKVDEDVRVSNVSVRRIGGGPDRAALSFSGPTTVVSNVVAHLPPHIRPVLFRDGLGQMVNVAVVETDIEPTQRVESDND